MNLCLKITIQKHKIGLVFEFIKWKYLGTKYSENNSMQWCISSETDSRLTMQGISPLFMQSHVSLIRKLASLWTLKRIFGRVTFLTTYNLRSVWLRTCYSSTCISPNLLNGWKLGKNYTKKDFIISTLHLTLLGQWNKGGEMGRTCNTMKEIIHSKGYVVRQWKIRKALLTGNWLRRPLHSISSSKGCSVVKNITEAWNVCIRQFFLDCTIYIMLRKS